MLVAVTNRPRLSWVVPLERDGQQQVAWEVEFASTVFSATSSDPWCVVVDRLASNRRYSWRVRVLDERDHWSEWSRSAVVETGPFSFDDWASEWVAAAPLSTISREFTVGVGVARARLHLTAQGLVRAAVNDVVVNADSSDPSRTDLGRALYRTYDVTDLLTLGQNSLALTAAHGEWERTGLDPRVLAELVIVALDGSRLVVGSGDGMSASSSQVLTELPFYLESHDATALVLPASAPRVLSPAAIPIDASAPPAEVLPDGSPPLRVVADAACEEVGRINGDRVFQGPGNIAGRSRVVLVTAVPRGTRISIIHGEHLDPGGRVDTTNLTLPIDNGRARQVVEHVATGEPGQALEAWFCYHGFAFLQVSGLPQDAVIEVTARLLHSDLEAVSGLSTDEPLIGTMVSRARRTLLNNVHGIPDEAREQSGWTGDTASVTDFEFASFDMEGFFRKWLGDLRTSQQPDGSIPAVAPDVRVPKVPCDPVWGAAVQRVLLGHWLNYGDIAVVEENIGVLRAWVDFQLSCVDVEGVIGGAPISFGHDWLALAQTPPRLLHTAATMEALDALAQLESVLGGGSAGDRLAQREALRSAAVSAFVDAETGSVGNGSQACLAIALWAGWLVGDAADHAGFEIEADVRARGNRVSSGFAATRTVVSMLAETGHSQVILDALRQPVEPGIGAMLDHGPGTLWENWWIDPANTGTGSLDNVGIGGPFGGWAERYLAGIRPTAAGFARFECRPCFVRGIDELVYETTTVRGSAGVSYRRVGAQVELSVMVPVGAEASVILPGAEYSVGAGRHQFVAEWRPEREVPVVDTGEWSAPSWMAPAADVDQVPSWLATAIAAGALFAPRSSLAIRESGLRCMPVPHAQLRGPVATVTGQAPVARLEFAKAADLSGARFVYAEVDACIANAAEPTGAHITVFAANGSSLASTGRVWAAGWSRVAVDLGEWPGRVEVVAVEVTVDFGPTSEAVSFHLGSIGASSRKRTW